MPDVFDFLEKLDITYAKYEHPAVFTVDDARTHKPDEAFWECKNLFLRNRKGDRHYLVTIEAEKQLNLKALGEELGEKVGFASPERLKQYLGIAPGSVSPFGLLNNIDHAVVFVLDKSALESELIGVHPNLNTQTLVMKTSDFVRAIETLENPFLVKQL
jgi:Ala-tRNA(Pro) deacylase